MIRSTSVFLLVVGIVWGILASGLFLIVSGYMGGDSTSNPVVIGKGLFYFSWMFLGPLLLIVGASLLLAGSHQRLGALLTAIGCLVLTILMGYQTVQAFHVDPLAVKPPYALYVLGLCVTILADIGAVQLCRFTYLTAAT